MNISNTLWNDTSSGEIAYSEQLKERLLKDYIATLTETEKERIPAIIKSNSGVFQDKLNQFFLDHYIAYEHFLNDVDLADETINTWKELENFLEGISDDEAKKLLNIVEELQVASGMLNVRMSSTVPGMLEAVTTTSTVDISNSFLNDKTGAVGIVYTY